MKARTRPLVHDTLKGALLCGTIVGAVATVQALRAGVSLLAVAQPILVFALIGFTVGGLAGPLVGKAARRRRQNRTPPP